MKNRSLAVAYGIIAGVVSLPFVFIHLTAKPDDAPITPLQHLAAAAANFFGPWGVVLVRLVDFPNAGLRSFSWGLAVGLTVVGTLLLVGPWSVSNRAVRVGFAVAWAVFTVVWFGVGLGQIADGLL